MALHFLGPIGAALAFTVRVGIDLLLLARFSGILQETVKLAVVPVLLLLAALAGSLVADRTPVPGAAIGAVAVILACWLAAVRLKQADVDPVKAVRDLFRRKPPQTL